MSHRNGEVPYKHPWPEDQLGNVASVTVGGTPSTSVPEYWNGEVPWMSSGDVHLRRILDVPTRISDLGLRCSNATMVDPPAVAIGLAGQGKTRGTVAIVLCRLCTNQSVALIKGNPHTLDTNYLLYNLEYRYAELRSRSAGGGRAGLSKQLLEAVPVPLPSTTEQSKIADVLSTVDRAIEQTQALIAKQHRIKAGLMQDLLSRGIDAEGNLRSEETHEFKDSPLGRIPIEWDIAELGSLTESYDSITYGVLKPGPYVENGVPLLQIEDVIHGDIQIELLHRISPELDSQYKRTRLRGGEVVVSLVGTIGRIAHLPPSVCGFNLHRNLALVRPVAKHSSRFLYHFLRSEGGQKEFARNSLGSTQALFNLGSLRALCVPLPDPDEQERIAERSDALDAASAKTALARDKLIELKTAMMQDLLTGDKRVTPLLEPAEIT
ncbi:EcoKI restriction-modification system protein HsdS [Botrimarina colliarenosi]|uniref:EcoKI restriction-modification system protein HsdS n=1 Tax=Botrimarina colliarenosi TaxID=2528001 RepID=A0A5C6AA67_9BACT|nr:restriction endonuclease subunit S [Botrimarina colliarenosi]TWT96914.1 EcoKI restriction-modification system protein HsdS [Botrimarina colliarenosi]